MSTALSTSSATAVASSSSALLTRSLYRKILHSVSSLQKNSTFDASSSASNKKNNQNVSPSLLPESPSEIQAAMILNSVFSGLLPTNSVLEYCHLQREKQQLKLKSTKEGIISSSTPTETQNTTRSKLITSPLNATDVAKLLFRDCIQRAELANSTNKNNNNDSSNNSTNNSNKLNYLPYGFETARRLRVVEQSFLVRDEYLKELKAIIEELKTQRQEDGNKVISGSKASSSKENTKATDATDEDGTTSAITNRNFIEAILQDDNLTTPQKQEFIRHDLEHSIKRVQDRVSHESLMFEEAKRNHQQKLLKSSSSSNNNSSNLKDGGTTNNTSGSTSSSQKHQQQQLPIVAEHIDVRKSSEYPSNVLCVRETPAPALFDLPEIFRESPVTFASPSPLHCISTELPSLYAEGDDKSSGSASSSGVGKSKGPSSSSPFDSKLSKHRKQQIAEEKKKHGEKTSSAYHRLEERLFGGGGGAGKKDWKQSPSNNKSDDSVNIVSLQEQFASFSDPLWPNTVISENQKLPLPPDLCKSLMRVCAFQRDGEFDDISRMMLSNRSKNKSKESSSSSSSTPAAPTSQEGAFFSYDLDSFGKLTSNYKINTMLPVDTIIAVPPSCSSSASVPSAEGKSTEKKKKAKNENNEGVVNFTEEENWKGMIRVSCSALCEQKLTMEELAKMKKLKEEIGKKLGDNNISNNKSGDRNKAALSSSSSDAKNNNSNKSSSNNNNSKPQSSSSTPEPPNKPLHPFLEKLRKEKLEQQQKEAEDNKKKMEQQHQEQEGKNVIDIADQQKKQNEENKLQELTSSVPSVISSSATPAIVEDNLESIDDIEGESLFRYKIRIENLSKCFAIICLTRHWYVMDFAGQGSVTEVCGPGFVGYMPLLGPTAVTSYESGTALKSTKRGGIMFGKFQCIAIPYPIVAEFEEDQQQQQQDDLTINKKKMLSNKNNNDGGNIVSGLTNRSKKELLLEQLQKYDKETGCLNRGFQFDLDVGPIHLNPSQKQYVKFPSSIQELRLRKLEDMKKQQQQQRQREIHQQKQQQQQTKKKLLSSSNSKLSKNQHQYKHQSSKNNSKKMNKKNKKGKTHTDSSSSSPIWSGRNEKTNEMILGDGSDYPLKLSESDGNKVALNELSEGDLARQSLDEINNIDEDEDAMMIEVEDDDDHYVSTGDGEDDEEVLAIHPRDGEDDTSGLHQGPPGQQYYHQIEIDHGDAQTPDEAGLQMIFESTSSSKSIKNNKNDAREFSGLDIDDDDAVTEISVETDEKGNIIGVITKNSDDSSPQARKLAEQIAASIRDATLNKQKKSSSSPGTNKNSQKVSSKKLSSNKGTKDEDFSSIIQALTTFVTDGLAAAKKKQQQQQQQQRGGKVKFILPEKEKEASRASLSKKKPAKQMNLSAKRNTKSKLAMKKNQSPSQTVKANKSSKLSLKKKKQKRN